MSPTHHTAMTLYNWNILRLPDDREIFVGLCQRPEVVPPFAPPQQADELLDFTLHNSDPIDRFDLHSGVGFTLSGNRYVLLGPPSDPSGLIRFSVGEMMQPDDIRWKYDFAG